MGRSRPVGRPVGVWVSFYHRDLVDIPHDNPWHIP